MDIDIKLRNCLKIQILLNICLDHRRVSKKTRIKLCNALPLPAPSYDSENWIIKARDARRITQTEMKYMRKTAGYTWTDYKTNT